MELTKSLHKLRNFSLEKSFNYIDKQRVASRRCKEQGFRFFAASYIHNIDIEECQGPFKVCAICWRSQRKNEAGHKIEILFSPGELDNDLDVVDAHCSCQAG